MTQQHEHRYRVESPGIRDGGVSFGYCRRKGCDEPIREMRNSTGTASFSHRRKRSRWEIDNAKAIAASVSDTMAAEASARLVTAEASNRQW